MTQQTAERTQPKPRGRPLSFSRDEVLDLAISEFRRSGYDGATMDKLAEAMGITKPSIYRAFGDRKSLYRAAIKKYGANISVYWRSSSERQATLKDYIETFLDDAVTWFVSDLNGIRGCLMLSTMSHATVDEDLMEDLRWLITSMEEEVATYIKDRYPSELSTAGTATQISLLLVSFSHSLATRARAGVSDTHLREDARIMAKSVLAVT